MQAGTQSDASAASPSATPSPRPPVQVWVDLVAAPLAAGPSASAKALTDLQDALMARMRRLGAVELGRVRVLRNAIAVEVDASQLDAIRALEGVRAVTPVRHADRLGPPSLPRGASHGS